MSKFIKVWQALEDAGDAIVEFKQAEDVHVRRRRWVTAITLLSTINDILLNFEIERDEKIKIVETQWFSELQSDYKNRQSDTNYKSIYFDFIRQERNLTVHQYLFMFVDQDLVVTNQDGLEEEISAFEWMPMVDGKYAGDDCRDLLHEAYEWWECQLKYMEQEVSKL